MEQSQTKEVTIDKALEYAAGLMQSGQLHEAFNLCIQILKIQADNARVLMLLRQIYQMSKPDDRIVLQVILGDAYYAMGLLKESAEAFLNSLELDELCQPAYIGLGKTIREILDIHTRKGQTELCFQYLPEFRSQKRTFLMRQVFVYDEQQHGKNTLYLTRHTFKPPVFSIVSPWGQIANNNR
jgi:tetratricopeptide (TPR) repeat protein